VLVTLPAQLPDDNANQQGLKREYHSAGANRLYASRFALRIQDGESFHWRSLSFGVTRLTHATDINQAHRDTILADGGFERSGSRCLVASFLAVVFCSTLLGLTQDSDGTWRRDVSSFLSSSSEHYVSDLSGGNFTVFKGTRFDSSSHSVVEIRHSMRYHIVGFDSFLSDGCPEFIFELFMADDFEPLTPPNTARGCVKTLLERKLPKSRSSDSVDGAF
jgi:hypothetical protein